MNHQERHIGRELELMLSGEKPMAAFYRVVFEDIDEFSGQDFNKYVRSGFLKRNIFYVTKDYGRVLYTVFTKPSEQWRFDIYKALKLSGQYSWSEDQEKIEGYLLGYKVNLSR